MTVEPLLELAARLLAKHRLDAVLIGNAAAALQGSPVTTLDLDFMFRKTPGNLRKPRCGLMEQMNKRTNFLRKRRPGGGSSP